MQKILLLLLCFPIIIPFSFNNILNRTKGVISTALDFVPIVSNIKGLGEVTTGKDLITGQNLTKTERTLSFIGAIPFGNYLKNVKYLKNAKSFFKASKRAKDAGKLKNFVNFAKAGARAVKNAETVQKVVKGAAKITNGILKQIGIKKDNQSDTDTDK